MKDRDVDRIWKEFWLPLVRINGKINMDRVKAELYDYHTCIHEVSLVYDELTGARFSKANTQAQFVIDAAIEHFEKLYHDDENADGLPKCDMLVKRIENLETENAMLRAVVDAARRTINRPISEWAISELRAVLDALDDK